LLTPRLRALRVYSAVANHFSQEKHYGKLHSALAVLFGTANFVFFAASDMAGQGLSWVNNMCSAARLFCHSLQQAAFAATLLAGFWLEVKIESAG
jgi:hypothetical protein